MQIIKNAIVYKASLPAIEAMAAHAAEVPFTPVPETMVNSYGFTPVVQTGELVTPIEGGYAMSVRYDEKILPQSVVKKLIAERAAAAEEESGVQLDKEAYGALKEKVMAELISKALVKTSVVTLFYHPETRLLIVPTTSKHMAGVAIALLIKACGAVETTTIHVSDLKGGLTTRLTNYVEGDEQAFDGFKVGDSCLLKLKSQKASFDLDNLDTARQGIREALGAGMSCERMELEHGTMSFKLTKDFQLRGIDFFGELTEAEEQEREDYDFAMLWRCEASIQLLQLVAAINAMCQLFGYKEGAEKAGEQRAEEEIEDDLYAEAVAFVRETQRGSISSVQRKLLIGYNRAARMIERMEREGIVSPMKNDGSREVIG